MRMEAQFSANTMIRRTLEVYEQILRRKAVSGEVIHKLKARAAHASVSSRKRLRLSAEDRVRLQTGVPGHIDELDPERRALKELIEREDSRRAAQRFQ